MGSFGWEAKTTPDSEASWHNKHDAKMDRRNFARPNVISLSRKKVDQESISGSASWQQHDVLFILYPIHYLEDISNSSISISHYFVHQEV